MNLHCATQVRAHRKATDKFSSPAVIHCSAGVGRTGAFISVDHAIDAYKKKERIDLNDVVRTVKLRNECAYGCAVFGANVYFRLPMCHAARQSKFCTKNPMWYTNLKEHAYYVRMQLWLSCVSCSEICMWVRDFAKSALSTLRHSEPKHTFNKVITRESRLHVSNTVL